MYLFDSDIFRLLTDGDAAVARRFAQNAGTIWLSSVAAEEAVSGALGLINRSRSVRNSLSLPEAHEFFVDTLVDLQLMPILTFSEEADKVFCSLPPAAIRKGAQDARIAAQATAHGLTVVTRNLRDFEAIGAPCEDWSR